jgi:hypothetical protein
VVELAVLEQVSEQLVDDGELSRSLSLILEPVALLHGFEVCWDESERSLGDFRLAVG